MGNKNLFILVSIFIILALFLTGCSNNSVPANSDNTYTVSGRITDTDGIGLKGITIHFSDDRGVITTDSNGNWEITGLSGSTNITPVDNNYTFNPESLHVSNSDSNVNFIGKPKLNSPITVSIPRVNESSAEVNWTEIEDAEKYEVYRSENGDDYKRISETKSIQFSDHGLEADKIYYYKVKAVDEDKGITSTLNDYMAVKTPSSGEMSVNNNVVIFSKEQIERFFVDETVNGVKLKRNDKTDRLETDNIVVSEFCESVSLTLSHRVISVKKNENEVILELEELKIEDLVDMSGDASFSQEIEDTISIKALEQQKDKIVNNISQSLGAPVPIDVNFKSTSRGTAIKVKVPVKNIDKTDITITFYIDNKLHTTFSKEQWYLKMDTGFKLNYKLEMSTPCQGGEWLGLLGSEKFTETVSLGEIPLTSTILWVGVVPIYIDADLPIEAFLSGEIRGSAYLSYQTRKYIQSAGFDIMWDDLENSGPIYDWSSSGDGKSGFTGGFLFQGSMKFGLSEKIALSVWKGEIIKAGAEEYLEGKLTYNTSTKGSGATGELSRKFNFDAIVEPGKHADDVLENIGIDKLDASMNIASIDLGSTSKNGPTIQVKQGKDKQSLVWNKSYVFTFIDSIESDKYNILISPEGTDEWEEYKTVGKSELKCIIEEPASYKVLPIVEFCGMDYPGLESNTIDYYPPIVEMEESLDEMTANLSGSVVDSDDGHIANVSIDWADGNTISVTDGFGQISEDHSYTEHKIYPITITAEDNDGYRTVESISLCVHDWKEEYGKLIGEDEENHQWIYRTYYLCDLCLDSMYIDTKTCKHNWVAEYGRLIDEDEENHQWIYRTYYLCTYCNESYHKDTRHCIHKFEAVDSDTISETDEEYTIKTYYLCKHCNESYDIERTYSKAQNHEHNWEAQSSNIIEDNEESYKVRTYYLCVECNESYYEDKVYCAHNWKSVDSDIIEEKEDGTCTLRTHYLCSHCNESKHEDSIYTRDIVCDHEWKSVDSKTIEEDAETYTVRTYYHCNKCNVSRHEDAIYCRHNWESVDSVLEDEEDSYTVRTHYLCANCNKSRHEDITFEKCQHNWEKDSKEILEDNDDYYIERINYKCTECDLTKYEDKTYEKECDHDYQAVDSKTISEDDNSYTVRIYYHCGKCNESYYEDTEYEKQCYHDWEKVDSKRIDEDDDSYTVRTYYECTECGDTRYSDESYEKECDHDYQAVNSKTISEDDNSYTVRTYYHCGKCNESYYEDTEYEKQCDHDWDKVDSKRIDEDDDSYTVRTYYECTECGDTRYSDESYEKECDHDYQAVDSKTISEDDNSYTVRTYYHCGKCNESYYEDTEYEKQCDHDWDKVDSKRIDEDDDSYTVRTYYECTECGDTRYSDESYEKECDHDYQAVDSKMIDSDDDTYTERTYYHCNKCNDSYYKDKTYEW